MSTLGRLLYYSDVPSAELIKFVASRVKKLDAGLATLLQEKAALVSSDRWNPGDILTLLSLFQRNKFRLYESTKAILYKNINNLHKYSLLDLSQLLDFILHFKLEVPTLPIVTHFTSNLSHLIANCTVKNIYCMLNSLSSLNIKLDAATVGTILLHFHRNDGIPFKDYSNFINAIARHMDATDWDKMVCLVEGAMFKFDPQDFDLEGTLDIIDAIRLVTINYKLSCDDNYNNVKSETKVFEFVNSLDKRLKILLNDSKCEPRLARIALKNWTYFRLKDDSALVNLISGARWDDWSFQGIFDASHALASFAIEPQFDILEAIAQYNSKLDGRMLIDGCLMFWKWYMNSMVTQLVDILLLKSNFAPEYYKLAGLILMSTNRLDKLQLTSLKRLNSEIKASVFFIPGPKVHCGTFDTIALYDDPISNMLKMVTHKAYNSV